MGKKLDALLGRTFKAAKFKPVITLAISRIAVLKNQRQIRLRQARSDVLQLLQLGHHERALLRVEHVIKEQNMLDVYDKIEGYCNLVIERVHLIEQERECPEELKEAASGLLYAASRCGDFPEIQEIRAVFTSRFGKEFASRAIELRNNCGVHPQIIQKLSTRMPSLESRMKQLQEIASENNIVLQLEESSSVLVEEQFNAEKENQNKHGIGGENIHNFPNTGKDEELSDSFKARKKYKDVADAAQAAFESAAFAAAAARAAVELSRSEPHDPDDHNSSSPKPSKFSHGHKPLLEETEVFDETQGEEHNKNINRVEKPKHSLGSNSTDEILKVSVDAEIEADTLKKEVVLYESNDDANNKMKINQSSMPISSKYSRGKAVGSGSQKLESNKEVTRTKMQSGPQLDLEKRPISVRTR
ncbi:hypothetical protein PIB30_055846 [Stylosanthes scabra]|uniref:Vacuolar protein sorting-associated protein Ist1 n=1 Tax=Stylosanthes scabra TaxID=79078 RepID=A0ABU6QJX2_9FABA|nr:hypothetical protein [Stylosanthes scabra]